MYDKDGNGSVDLEEMVEIIGTLYDMEGASKVSSTNQLFKKPILRHEAQCVSHTQWDILQLLEHVFKLSWG